MTAGAPSHSPMYGGCLTSLADDLGGDWRGARIWRREGVTLNDFNRGTLSGAFGGVGLHIGVSHQDWPTGLVMFAIGLAVIVFLHRDTNTQQGDPRR
jgi:hypothetical protein